MRTVEDILSDIDRLRRLEDLGFPVNVRSEIEDLFLELLYARQPAKLR